MVDFSRSVQEEMVTFNELMASANEAASKNLSQVLEDLTTTLIATFDAALAKTETVWEYLEQNFPVDKDMYGNRFNCKNNSIALSLRQMIGQHEKSSPSVANQDLLYNMTELLLLDMVESSFRLVCAYNQLQYNFSSELRIFIFGRQLEDMSKYLLKTRRHCEKTLGSCINKFKQCLEESGPSSPGRGSLIPVEDRYSTEFRLYANTNSALETLHNLIDILQTTQDTAMTLLRAKIAARESGESSSNISSTKTELCFLRAELDLKLKTFSSIAGLELELIKKVLKDNLKRPPVMKEAVVESTSLLSEYDQDDDYATRLMTDTGIYEYGTAAKVDGEEILSSEPLDELFELLPGRDYVPATAVAEEEHPEDDEEVHQVRSIVLEQLKSALKPRQQVMKQREDEAYRRVYGDRPGSSSLEDIVEDIPVIGRQKKKNPILLDFGKTESLDSDDDDNEFSEIAISESPTNLFGDGDFKSRLNKLLHGGTGGAGGSSYDTVSSD